MKGKIRAKRKMSRNGVRMGIMVGIMRLGPFIQLDDPFMLLEEFTLPPTVVQSAIRRPPIQANNFELKTVTLQMLQNIMFHGLQSENPNMHLTNFIEVCDTIKYNRVTEEALN